MKMSSGIRLQSVLLAYDFSQLSHKPLRHALSISRHYEAKLHVVHVVSSLGYTIAGPDALNLARGQAEREMQQLEQNLRKSEALAGLTCEFIVRDGDVWEQLELLIKLKGVDLVVVGTHGRAGLGKLLLGSVAERVFRHADCFVATVGPGSYEDSLFERDNAGHTFLFATDFGAASLQALPYALSLASQFEAKLVVLHVLSAVPVSEGFHWSKTGDLVQMREKAKADAQEKFAGAISQAARMALRPEFAVRFGISSDQILLASQALKADLIILGLNGPSGIQATSHMPWDAAYKVACAAHCPVVTVRSSMRSQAVSNRLG
jgi:nucleotide-binding universal stress UspA family protein